MVMLSKDSEMPYIYVGARHDVIAVSLKKLSDYTCRPGAIPHPTSRASLRQSSP